MIACPRQSMGREDKNKKSLSEGGNVCKEQAEIHATFEVQRTVYFDFLFISLLQTSHFYLQFFASSLTFTV